MAWKPIIGLGFEPRPLTTTGRHSPSWNQLTIGVKVLGDYDKASFSSGRGLGAGRKTVSALASIYGALGLKPKTIRLYKEDKATTHGDCPGKAVVKKKSIAEVEAKLPRHCSVGHDQVEPHPP